MIRVDHIIIKIIMALALIKLIFICKIGVVGVLYRWQ
jgi:hypothetical protein